MFTYAVIYISMYAIGGEKLVHTGKIVNNDRWVRSKDGVLAGVCKGLGESFGIDPILVRIFWLASVFFLGVGFLIYVLLALTLPREDRVEHSLQEKFLGVCYRIHKKTNLEIGLVRFLCLLLAISSFGATMVGYIVLYFLLPEGDERPIRRV